jgi:hypothetical protein
MLGRRCRRQRLPSASESDGETVGALAQERIPVKSTISPQASCTLYGDPPLLERGYGICARYPKREVKRAFGKLETREKAKPKCFGWWRQVPPIPHTKVQGPWGATLHRRTPGSSLLWVGPSAHNLGEVTCSGRNTPAPHDSNQLPRRRRRKKERAWPSTGGTGCPCAGMRNVLAIAKPQREPGISPATPTAAR